MIRVITIALMLVLFTPEIIAQKRTLLIGAITDNAPISFVNEKGVTVGFSIDITRALMERLDTDYTIELFDYKTALNRLDSGKIDLVCSLGEFDIMLNKYYLSMPYITLDIDIITRNGEDLVNLNDIAGKRIITDSEHYSYHNKLIATGKDFSSNIILVNNTREGLNMLSKGEGDCAITVTKTAQSILQHDSLSNLKIQNSDLDGVNLCFASTDRTLIRDINKEIVDIKQSGTFEEIRYNWFGTEKQTYPISYIYYGLAIALILIAASTTFVLVLRKKIKQGVQESTSRISELQENIKIALNTGGIALWKYNPQEQKFITIEGESLAGTGLTMDENMNLLHPEDRANQKAIISDLLSGERSQASATFRYRTENGDYRTYESTMSVVNNHQGKVVGILGSQQDITDTYKQMQSAKVLSASLPLMKSYSWYIDMRDGIQYFNCDLKLERDIHQLNSIDLFIDIIHKDDQHIFRNYWATISNYEKATEVFLVRIDLEKIGEYEWWECYGAVETKYDGNKPYKVICGITINVNEREKRSIEFKRIAQQVQLVLHNSNSILVYLNTDYEVQWSNSKVALNGIAARHYQSGTKCYSTFGYESPCPGCPMSKAIEQRKFTTYEFDMQQHGCYLTTAIPIISSEDSVDGVVLRIDDITEQMALIEETRTAKEYGEKLYSDLNNNTKLLTTVLEEMPLGLFIKDIKDNFRYLFASNFFCDNVVQKSSVEIIKHTDYEIFPIEAAEKFRKDDLAIINNGSDEVQYIGKEHLNVKGKEFVVETYKLILKLPNDVTLLIGYCTDITENEKINIRLQESKERAEQSDKLKSAFLANMSHEIRTPLNAIVGFSDLLVVSDDQEDREEFGKIIANNNTLLLNLINDILDISKIEAGSFTFINELFDVNELCTEMNSIFGMQVKQNVELIYTPAKEVVNILFDKNRFRQILNNFLSNAVKFTPAGRIEFGYELIDRGIKVVVKDTGIGISVEDHKKVFGRFAKFDDFAQGTGLGLAICKALVELRGGKIGFESTKNVGSTFWFWIPCQFEMVNILKRIEDIGTIKRDRDKQNFRILIAEDIDSNYMLIGAILKEYELTRAIDGKQAIELCQSNKYDLVFMDIKMPNVTGLEATRAIRQFDTTTPIIALTANAFDSDKAAAKEAGCNDFTAKPVSKQHILNIINKWISQ